MCIRDRKKGEYFDNGLNKIKDQYPKIIEEVRGVGLMKGIKDQDFVDRFDVSFFDVYQDEVSDLEAMGLIEYSGGYIRLTERGRLLANEVFLRFF